LPIAEKAKKEGFTEIFLPDSNADEARVIEGITVYGAKTLWDVIRHINTKKTDPDDESSLYIPHVPIITTPREKHVKTRDIEVDFADIKGQESAKRGLEIAAAGGHNIIMHGPPGTGKTMLARAFTHLLPPLSFEDMLEVTSIYSIGGHLHTQDGNRTILIEEPPFRTPHHTASYVSLVGGGVNLLPGEVTLAHKGVLFLDEFRNLTPEYLKHSANLWKIESSLYLAQREV
jgi:magnesium chelatase family protein